MTMELVLPEQQKPARDDPMASPRRAQAWLEEIRQGGDRESARRFIEGLQRFNRIQLRLGKRLKLLELLRPTTRYVIDRLAQRISTQKLPLDDLSQRNFRALMVLLREKALAYDICAAELIAAKHPARRTLALVSERALYYRGEMLLRCAPVHAPIPQNFWHDSNAIFSGAERHRCETRRVRNDELLARRKRQTPAHMFRRLLLFSLAPTDGLRRMQAERLFQRTESWGDLVQVSQQPPSEPTNTLYYVDLERADGPRPASAASEATASMRWAEFAAVLAAAQQELPEAPAEGSILEPGQVDAKTLQGLIDSWSVHSGRTEERVVRGELVDVAVSLKEIHARLAGETAPVEEPKPAPQAERTFGSGSFLALQTIEAPERRWRDAEDDEVEPVKPAPAETARPAKAVPESERNWMLIEAGGGGFRLRWQSKASAVAVVGDLVALRDERVQASGSIRWILGTVRRIRMIDQHRFDAGVQTLGLNPVHARMRREPDNPHRKRDRSSEPTEPALVLPAVRARKTPASVLVAANTFREGEVVELDLPDRTVRARLGPTRDSSAAFTRFRLEKPPTRGRSAAGPGDEE